MEKKEGRRGKRSRKERRKMRELGWVRERLEKKNRSWEQRTSTGPLVDLRPSRSRMVAEINYLNQLPYWDTHYRSAPFQQWPSENSQGNQIAGPK